MKIFFITLIIAIFFLFENLFADAGEKQFGLGYSTISGGGLVYQGELDPDIYLKISAFPYYFGNNPPDDLDINFNIGSEIQFDLWDLNDKRLYAFAGGSFFYIELRSTETSRVNDIEIIKKDIHIDRIYNYGLGIGFEYIWLETVAFSASLGVQGQSSGVTGRVSSFFDRNPEGETFWGIGGGIGIRYAFP